MILIVIIIVYLSMNSVITFSLMALISRIRLIRMLVCSVLLQIVLMDNLFINLFNSASSKVIKIVNSFKVNSIGLPFIFF